MALSKRKMKKLGIPVTVAHGLVVGDKFYLYGDEIGTVTKIEGTSFNGVTFEWNGRTLCGLPPGKEDTTWEKVVG